MSQPTFPDRPDLSEILRTAREYVARVAPSLADASDRHEGRIVAYLLDMAGRELATGAERMAAHRSALAALLGEDAAIPELRARLAARLRAGDLDDRLDEVAEVMLELTADQVRIVRPSHLDPRPRRP